ncbi:MAG: Gfo/Idh/MocA family oxidoreductase, partial [Planctomycetes bacterium]|nr:Gfo/Idh/MocA family oxidoreductase [Planctomycetota bacterium]
MNFKPTRRAFLTTAGAACAAPYVITSAALGAPGVASASNRITTALIGSGGRGQQIMAGGDKVIAVCDVDATHRDAAKASIDKAAGNTDCAAYSDFREVLDRDDIDGVVVATPDHWHVLIAAAAIRAGKGVYCEKPLSYNIREGRLLTDLVERYNGILQVGSQQRSIEKFIKACELVRNGRIGELQKVQVQILARPGSDNAWRPRPIPPELDFDMWLGPAPYSRYQPDRVHYKFRFVSDFSGGDVTNWGAHHLDIAQLGIGADGSGPISVEGTGKHNTGGIHDTFYDINLDFKYANGVTLEFRSGGNEMKTGNVLFQGSEGWIRVSRENLDASPKSLLDSRIDPDEIHLGPTGEGGTHMGIWLECVRNRSPKHLNVPAAVGHGSAIICHLANICMELKRPLKWDPAAERFIGDDMANR